MSIKETKPGKTIYFSDYLYIIYKWRKIFFINLIAILLISIGIAFIVPKKYKSTATIIMAPDNTGGVLGGLSSFLGGGNNILSFNTKMLGGGVFQEDLILGIMNSRSVLSNVICKFNLLKYYKIKNNNFDLAIKKFQKDISFDPNEYGLIEVSVINKDPRTSADIANYLVSLADSMNIEMNIKHAKKNRIYIENRYLKNIADLRSSDDSLSQFQKRYGAYAVPEQIKVAVNIAGQLETELVQNEVMLNTLEEQLGSKSSSYKNIEMKINALKTKLISLKSKPFEKEGDLFVSFQKMPDLQKGYIRKFREVEIQYRLLEFVYPLYEQAKMEEQKSVPTVIIVDKAISPQLKYRPKRAAIVLGIFFIALFIHVMISLRAQYMLHKEYLRNPIENFECRIYKKMARLYKINFND